MTSAAWIGAARGDAVAAEEQAGAELVDRGADHRRPGGGARPAVVAVDSAPEFHDVEGGEPPSSIVPAISRSAAAT